MPAIPLRAADIGLPRVDAPADDGQPPDLFPLSSHRRVREALACDQILADRERSGTQFN